VYLTYGMHHCLNVVTEPDGISAAVLLRAIAPTHGRDLMAVRCPRAAVRDLGRGPGRLCQALALTLADNGADLTGPDLWLSHTSGLIITPDQIATSARIGISQGIDLPWRFFLRGHPALSGPSKLNRSP